uniref:Uncharacterized protein n=1 Tax=Arundo donax TaxID=35708 RepID=A0A0A9FQ84_ARUDO
MHMLKDQSNKKGLFLYKHDVFTSPWTRTVCTMLFFLDSLP